MKSVPNLLARLVLRGLAIYFFGMLVGMALLGTLGTTDPLMITLVFLGVHLAAVLLPYRRWLLEKRNLKPSSRETPEYIAWREGEQRRREEESKW
jgi:phosphotransferase system  glucose/maltose/N-acetylglucosamine-specific IIC component